MSESRALRLDELLRRLHHSRLVETEQGQIAARFLEAASPALMVELGPVSAAGLLRTYRIRRQRPNDVIGAEDLMSVLESWGREVIDMSVVELDGKVVSFWADPVDGQLLACVIGNDQRQS